MFVSYVDCRLESTLHAKPNKIKILFINFVPIFVPFLFGSDQRYASAGATKIRKRQIAEKP